MRVNILSPVSSWGTLAMEILEPESRRISVILDPARPLERGGGEGKEEGGSQHRADQRRERKRMRKKQREETYMMHPTMSEGIEMFWVLIEPSVGAAAEA
jgi:hypothetical protein